MGVTASRLYYTHIALPSDMQKHSILDVKVMLNLESPSNDWMKTNNIQLENVSIEEMGKGVFSEWSGQYVSDKFSAGTCIAF